MKLKLGEPAQGRAIRACAAVCCGERGKGKLALRTPVNTGRRRPLW